MSEGTDPLAPINFELIGDLSRKPHHLLNLQVGEVLPLGVGEVLQEARNVHHLLDMAGIPQGIGYSSDIDARTYLAITALSTLRERLERISGWHARETGEGGMVGVFCVECGTGWPCDTRRMADGTYVDEEA